MDSASRRTVRNGAIGGVVGSALGFVPLVLLIAPLLGGGIAGYLEGRGVERGALAGGVAGVLMAALSTLITGVILFTRFGELPLSGGAPLAGLGIAALLSLAATIGQVVVAGVGGALGALLAADRQPSGTATAGARLPWGAIAVSLAAGTVTFLVVTVGVSVVLEPFIWLSVLVGIPVGFTAGTAVAVLGYRYFTRGPESPANWRAVGLGVVAVAVVFSLVLAGLYAVGQQRLDRTTDSTYEYRVTISADRTLENVTFYVPVPVEGDDSELGEQLVQSVRYSRDVPAVRGPDPEPAPVNFTYELVDTEHGRMLAIAADRIEVSSVYYREVENETMGWRERIPPEEYDPADPSMGVLDDGHFQFSVTAVANDTIETADPVGSEPLLVPQYNRTDVECSIHPSETQRCFAYDSRVYASYETDADTAVYVGVELSGRNEWFSGGWRGNEYREWASTEQLGPGTGWYRMEGTLDVGVGTYRV